MRHVDAMMFSRWCVVVVFMVTPLVVGCGPKADTPLDSAASPANQPSLDADSPIDLDSQAVSEANAIDTNPIGELPGELVADDGGVDEVDRPKSLFRSISRALQRGVSDAAGSAAESSDDPPESVDSDSTDPR